MATSHQAGGTQALPIACAFMAAGGRLMVSPAGKLVTGGNFAWMFSNSSAREARRSYTIGRRFYRRLRNPSFERSVKQLVVEQGEPVNGWLVLKAAR